eukprot:gene15268-16844_t
MFYPPDLSSSLTFGPEWLRALSGGNSGDGDPRPPKSTRKFKLAEFRYGREEMLALFTAHFKMPQELKDFGDVIMAEAPCEPLSLIPLTEEEERCQVAGVNSSIVLRMSGRGLPTRGRGAIRGARGGGRGRGDGQPGYYRSLSSEDGYNRDAYARRPWNEGSRGGSVDRGGGRGEMGPGRGGYEHRARITSDRTGSVEREAWREGDEDGGGWRISGQRSWRKGSADASKNWRSDHNKEEESADHMHRSRSWNRPSNDRDENAWRHQQQQAGMSSSHALPEWCQDDDDDEDLGTFDSSGQFKSSKQGNFGKLGQNHDKPVFEVGEIDADSPRQQTIKETTPAEAKIDSANNKKTSDDPDSASNVATKTPSPRPTQATDSQQKPVAISVADLEKELRKDTEPNVNTNSKTINTVINNSQRTDVVAEISKLMSVTTSEVNKQAKKNDVTQEADAMDHIRNLLDKLDDEVEYLTGGSSPSYQCKLVQIHEEPTELQQFAPPTQETEENMDPSILFAKKAEPGVSIKEMQDWIYRDPQGEIQGPFSNEEMLEWFKAGYFTMGLLVRRVCDEVFLPLGDAIKLWSRVPFQPGPAPPSITKQQQQPQQQQQLVEDLHQRPHNLNVAQDVSIWGDSPAQSPNLASTPWSPSVSQPEPSVWNQTKSPTAEIDEEKEKVGNNAVLERIKRDVEMEEAQRMRILDDQKSRQTEEGKSNKSHDQEKQDEESQGRDEALNESVSEENQSASEVDSVNEANNAKKTAEKKKKQDTDKKKADRERQQKREEEQRKGNEGPSWNIPTSSSAPSLTEIQRMEERRQMAIREKLQQLQAHEQRLQHQQQQQQRAAAGWGDKSGKPVASLRQIQEDEARQLHARQRNQQQIQQQQVKMNQSAMQSAWNTKGQQQQQQQQNYALYETPGGASFWDDVMGRPPSLDATSHLQQRSGQQKARTVSDSAFPTLAGPKVNKKTKDEDFVRRWFPKINPAEDFVQWVNKNLPAIGKLVDVATLVQFLQEVNSPYEVYEYIRSYFGDSSDAQTFAREYLEWRKGNCKSPNSQYQAAISESGMMQMNNELMSPDGDDPSGKKKKQKKKMQKVNPSLLGFSCNPDPDLINRGEIQSAMDAWNKK